MINDDQDREMRLANFEKQMRLCSKISNFIIEQTRITDRELLELAAKAAGYEIEVDQHEVIYCHEGSGPQSWAIWNPLTCDGDALRLAMKLNMTLIPNDGCNMAWAHIGMISRAERNQVYQAHDGDQCAALRRAIVRAAAEIGREMK